MSDLKPSLYTTHMVNTTIYVDGDGSNENVRTTASLNNISDNNSCSKYDTNSIRANEAACECCRYSDGGTRVSMRSQ